MKLIYRGMTYERHPSKADARPFVQVREPGAAYNLSYHGVTYRIAPQTLATQVAAKLVGHKMIYRGITYYKLIYQGSAPQTLATQVAAKLVSHKMIYRGITYYKVVYQGSTFSVNRNV